MNLGSFWWAKSHLKKLRTNEKTNGQKTNVPSIAKDGSKNK